MVFISDNFKTFKAKETKGFALKSNINRKFILEKSQWWGGFYKRLIGIIKRCLKKIAGKVFLDYDELTLLIEIEQILNTRPLTYLADKNEDEAITPSHLLYGQNIARRNFMYFVTEYCEQENTLLNKCKRLKMILTILNIVNNMLTEKKCLTQFNSKRMAAWLHLTLFAPSFKFYTFHYHVLKSADVSKM